MRYGTWKIDFSKDVEHGTVPTELLGVFQTSATDVVGYIPTASDITLLSQWSVTEMTASAFLVLAQASNPRVTMVNGLLATPIAVI